MHHFIMNLQPTTRTLKNGKIVVFYSPQQIEEIVPVTVRLTKSKESDTYKIGNVWTKYTNGIKPPHRGTDRH